jgi:hypothetical protein
MESHLADFNLPGSPGDRREAVKKLFAAVRDGTEEEVTEYEFC